MEKALDRPGTASSLVPRVSQLVSLANCGLYWPRRRAVTLIPPPDRYASPSGYEFPYTAARIIQASLLFSVPRPRGNFVFIRAKRELSPLYGARAAALGALRMQMRLRPVINPRPPTAHRRARPLREARASAISPAAAAAGFCRLYARGKILTGTSAARETTDVQSVTRLEGGPSRTPRALTRCRAAGAGANPFSFVHGAAAIV